MFVAALLVGAGALSIDVLTGGPGRASDLSEWERQSFRPGFRLLDSADASGYYICVFDTGRDEIAFCYQWHGSSEAEPRSHTLGVHGPTGDLHDLDRENPTDLSWTRNYVIASWAGSDGIVYPIKRGYRGKIRIRFRSTEDGEVRPVYSMVIDLTTSAVEPIGSEDAQ